MVARDAQQAVVAAILIVLMVAGSLSEGKILPEFLGGAAKTKVVEKSDDDLTSGTIYITSADGSLCERRLIDNATWRTRANGYVSCEDAISGATQKANRNPATRLEAIRDGFFQKR